MRARPMKKLRDFTEAQTKTDRCRGASHIFAKAFEILNPATKSSPRVAASYQSVLTKVELSCEMRSLVLMVVAYLAMTIWSGPHDSDYTRATIIYIMVLGLCECLVATL